MVSCNKEVLEQILVPGIVDYNPQFIEANERTIQEKGINRLLVNGEETVIMKMSDISSIYVEKSSPYLHGESRTITVTLQNKFRYTFTYETGNAIRELWKRRMKNPNLGFNLKDDRKQYTRNN